MPDPYGITQVDVPGVVNAVQTSQQNRLQQLLLQQHISAAERAAERENQFNMVLARVTGRGDAGKGGTAGAVRAYGGTPATALPAPTTPISPASAAPTGAAGAVSAYGGAPAPITPPAAPAPAQAPAPAPADPSLRLDPVAAAQLVAIDPERGGQIVAQLRTLDTDRIHQLAAANDYLARFGNYLLHSNIPEAQWAAEIQRRAPDLQAHGVDPAQIQQFQANRQNVEYVVNQAQDIDHLIEHARPDLMVVPQNSTVINRDAAGTRDANGNPVNPTVYESPIVGTPTEPYMRPQNMSTMPQTEQSLRAHAAEAIRQGAPAAQVNARLDQELRALHGQGGAAQPQAPGTFPRQDGGAFDFRANPTPGG